MTSKRSRLARLALAAALAAAAATAAATSASGRAGADPVIRTVAYHSIKGPWLVWNKQTCRYAVAKSHPKTYAAQLRKQSTPLNVVFTPEATTFSVDALINGSVEQFAKLAGVKESTLSNDYPSTTRPLQVANQAAVVKADVVVSGNVLTNLYPQIQPVYEKACIPMVNMFNLPGPPHPAPGFQSGYTAQGEAMAAATVDIVKKRKWPAGQIWIVLCGNVIIGKGRNTLNDVNRALQEGVAKAFAIPKSRQSADINCASPEEARAKTIDWLTAHPQAKYVVASMWADAQGVAMAQALASKGYKDNAIVATGDASDAALELMADGDPILQVDSDKNFLNWGVYSISMAQDVAAGRPVPSFSEVQTVVVTPANVKQVLAERAAFLKKNKKK